MESWECWERENEASGRPPRLSPDVLRVIFDAMLFEESNKLRLKVTLLVMFLLVDDVGEGSCYLCLPIEKAPYPSCHWNPLIVTVSRIHREEALLISRMAFASGIDDGRDSRMWT